MANIIRASNAAPREGWLSMSNQGTDCFLEILICAASNMTLTPNQKKLIDFLMERKHENAIAPGTASFDVDEMPWIRDSLHEDTQCMLAIIEEAKKNSNWKQLGYLPNKDIVMPWLEWFENVTKQMDMKQAETFTNSIGMEFVLIPAGTFLMGAADDDENADDDERPRHEVAISRSFYLGKYPVTQAQWQAVMGNNPSRFKGADRPVEWVSWEDARAFIARLNALQGHYRLPTEAEWEYAARAGSTTRYSFGDDAERLGDHAWFKDNAGGETHPVGQKLPNAWGLHDMHGNVWEWVWDWYDDYDWRGEGMAGIVTDPLNLHGPGAGGARVLRGGGWADFERRCRSSSRFVASVGLHFQHVGFRLALALGDKTEGGA